MSSSSIRFTSCLRHGLPFPSVALRSQPDTLAAALADSLRLVSQTVVQTAASQLVTWSTRRMTSWPAAETLCCDELTGPQTLCSHCCDELTACCCRRRLILTLVVNAVCFKSFLFSGTKCYYWRRGQPVACTGWRKINRTIQPFNRVYKKLHKIMRFTLVVQRQIKT